MGESRLKTKHLLLLKEPFSLNIPYHDRQRVVIVADEQVEAERLSRARIANEIVPTHLPAESKHAARSWDLAGPPSESASAVVSRHLHNGLQTVQNKTGNLKQTLEDRTTRWAVRRQFGALMIGQSEAHVLHFGQGHPLKKLLYVGHPAKPDLYFPAAEFHRCVFEHKFIEAVTLLTSLGACRIVVLQEQGNTRAKERSGLFSGLGFTFARSEQSQLGAVFEAELPGNNKPFIPDGLHWYPDERTWQIIADARIANGAQKTSLTVTYATDYGIDTRVVKAAGACGINIGGRFQEQHDTIWRLDAEFPIPPD